MDANPAAETLTTPVGATDSHPAPYGREGAKALPAGITINAYDLFEDVELARTAANMLQGRFPRVRWWVRRTVDGMGQPTGRFMVWPEG